MPEQQNGERLVDVLSACSTQLHMQFDDLILSSGTCFFWRDDKDVYLVSNWHNLSGRNSLTLKHLDEKNAAEPNCIKIRVFLNKNPATPAEIIIYIRDNDGNPNWIEHPIYRNIVDVVCLKLPIEIIPHVICLNDHANGPLVTDIADDVFVIGYPLGISIFQTPVWKRASVATEPIFDVNGLPCFYIDTASARGMSGSPVIRRSTGGRTRDMIWAVFAGPVSTFIGVYSGRVITQNSLEAQLGIVWKKEVVIDIIKGKTRADPVCWKVA